MTKQKLLRGKIRQEQKQEQKLEKKNKRTQKTWIGYSQITRFNEETTSIWLKRGLNEAGRDVKALQQFISYLCAVALLYETFRPDKVIQIIYYSEEVYEAYNQDEWTPEMMTYITDLKGAFMPHHWARIWRKFYRRVRRQLLERRSGKIEYQLEYLDNLTITMNEAGIGEKIIGEMAQDASLAYAPG